MKTTITALAIGFTSFITTTLMAQIPNSGFENWIPIGNGQDPEGWHSTNLFDSTGVYFPITQSNDHFPLSVGNFSIRLENNLSLLPAFNAFGIIMTTRLDGTDRPLFPVTGHPDSLYGYYKFTSVNSDTMSINVYLSFNGTEIAAAHFTSSQTTTGWTSFTLPFPAYANADSARITIMSCNLEGGGAQGNSQLYVDNLSFDSLIVAGVTEHRSHNQNTVYPNPAGNKITIETRILLQQTSASIFNVTGQLLYMVKLDNNKTVLDVSNLASGVYILKLQNENIVDVWKLIRE